MGDIFVKGIGKFRIKGDTPDEEETRAMMEIMGIEPTPVTPVAEPTPAEKLVKAGPPDTLTADPTPALTSMTGGKVTRGAAEAIGGTVGSFVGTGVGAPTGPGAVGSMMAGATLGAAAGSLAFDTADAALRALTGQAPRAEEPLAAVKRAAEAGSAEFIWTGGATALIPALRAIKPKILGANTAEVARLQKVSEDLGVPVGIQALTERGFVRGASKVLGVFPFIGTPVKRGAVATEVALRGKYGEILDTLAPNATLADLGVDLSAAAVTRFQKFMAVSGELYGDFFKKASALPVPDIFPTAKAVQKASQLTGRVKAGEIILKSGDPLRSPVPKELDEYIENLMELPDHITAEQYRKLQLDLGDVMSSMTSSGLDITNAVELKKSLELGFNNPDVSRLSPEAGRGVVNALSAANEFYARHITSFKSPTAKRFGRVDKKMFKAGAFEAGTINEDEVFKNIFNAKSPQAVRQLRELVGPQKHAAAVRKFIEVEFDKVIHPKTGKFDAKAFSKALGVGDKGGEQALTEMLKGTGVRMDTLKNFLEIAERAGTVATPDVSAFIARRMTLGGFRAVLGGLVPLATVTTNPLAGGAAVLLIRHGAKIISDPAHLKAMTRAMDDTISDKQRRAILLRLGRQFFTEEERNKEKAKSRMRQPRGRLSPPK